MYQHAFEEIKSRLASTPMLAYPMIDRVEMDASVCGLEAVLGQVQKNDQIHPVAYAGRSVSPTKANYSITVLETLVVVT